jgi:cytochrome c peroxidase
MRNNHSGICGLMLLLCLGCKVDAPTSVDPPGNVVEKCWPSPDKPGVRICEPIAPVEIFAPEPGRPVVNPRVLQRFEPLREDFRQGKADAAALIDLGRMLYYDERLSRTATMSCNTCHPLDKYGVINEATPLGVDGKRGPRNAPTVYNAAAQFAQFWDGRSHNVEEQAIEPIINPLEMGATARSVVTTLTSIAAYAPLFQAAFPHDRHPISLKNTGIAIGAFERGLSTPGRWDRYLRGNVTALSDKEKEGLRVFTSVGCMVCHTGELIGGTRYEKVGAAVSWPGQGDQGRGRITHDPADDMMFKVPSLRNAARTGPYFHDGSAKTLEEAVRMMGKYQLGEPLNELEVASIVAWIGSLTGELPVKYIQPPVLPGRHVAQVQGAAERGAP